MNSDYDVLKDWMFGKLTSLLENTEPNPKYPVLKMSLGEPTLGVPNFTKKILDINSKDWAKYPPSEAIPDFGNSILNYVKRRGLDLQELKIIEGCFIKKIFLY